MLFILRFLLSLTLAAALLSAPAAAQPTLFVNADATGAADGSSWADAFPDLQQALAVAAAGQEVWVAEGLYLPAPTADRDASFVLVSGTALYGGFDGTEATRDARDPAIHETVLSGDLGVPDDISDNAYHVVVASGVDDSTVLDGFTVTGGNGDGASPRNRGGGIYAEGGSPLVRNCRIVANRVVQTDGFGGGAGAFFGASGTPRFERVAFERNDGVGAIGGGLWLLGESGKASGAESEAERVQMYSDQALDAVVAGARGTGTPPVVLREVTFFENTSGSSGGARIESIPIVMIRTAFVRNSARDSAGGLRITGDKGHLVNVSFYGNTVEPNGTVSLAGGMNGFAATLTLTNVVFVGNVARFAGAYGQGGGSSVLTNVTFASNVATVEGAGIRITNGADLAVRNGVFWDNTIDDVDATSGFATLSHVLLEGGCPPGPPPPSSGTVCEALLDADPLFLRDPSPGPDETWGTPDDDYGDLRLREGSPAIDFGLADFLPTDTFDLDADGNTAEPLPLDLAGEPRVAGPEVDLGAYERPLPVAAEPDLTTPPAVTLDAYPNPARGPVAVALGLGRAQQTEITLYDVRGRRVTVLHDGPLAMGHHAFQIETVTLPAGLYLVRATGDGFEATQRITVLR